MLIRNRAVLGPRDVRCLREAEDDLKFNFSSNILGQLSSSSYEEAKSYVKVIPSCLLSQTITQIVSNLTSFDDIDGCLCSLRAIGAVHGFKWFCDTTINAILSCPDPIQASECYADLLVDLIKNSSRTLQDCAIRKMIDTRSPPILAAVAEYRTKLSLPMVPELIHAAYALLDSDLHSNIKYGCRILVCLHVWQEIDPEIISESLKLAIYSEDIRTIADALIISKNTSYPIDVPVTFLVSLLCSRNVEVSVLVAEIFGQFRDHFDIFGSYIASNLWKCTELQPFKVMRACLIALRHYIEFYTDISVEYMCRLLKYADISDNSQILLEISYQLAQNIKLELLSEPQLVDMKSTLEDLVMSNNSAVSDLTEMFLSFL